MAAQVTALAVIQEVTAVQVTPQAVIQEITAILVMLHMMVETTAAQVVVIQAAQIMVVQITQAVTAAMERQAVILLKYLTDRASHRSIPMCMYIQKAIHIMVR